MYTCQHYCRCCECQVASLTQALSTCSKKLRKTQLQLNGVTREVKKFKQKINNDINNIMDHISPSRLSVQLSGPNFEVPISETKLCDISFVVDASCSGVLLSGKIELKPQNPLEPVTYTLSVTRDGELLDVVNRTVMSHTVFTFETLDFSQGGVYVLTHRATSSLDFRTGHSIVVSQLAKGNCTNTTYNV